MDKEQKDEKIAKMTEEYEYRLKIKDDEVNKLKTKIEEMSKEFAAMLQVFYCIVKKTINLFY